MFQPFCNIVEQRIIDGNLDLLVQTRQTIDTVDDIDGTMVDNSAYRHITINLDTGDVIDNYMGPHGL